ncbi:DUF2642 domain-containing protein [Mesobacillus zeae]|uniref:DUF2642 domain-containing protein n=1 Tax=Mesobacillus zeae TaxID=1917180 RepID=A0A398BFI9_9BACI|nr:DUF2642 domain-containing protein [Mesobacillus zeae]RID88354.1 DUF2642 domain-containing protein [Mesobacillus zeae]
MTSIKSLLGLDVKVEISGSTVVSGILIDVGLDILVLFNGKKYLYIPMIHLHNIKERELAGFEEKTEQPKVPMPLKSEAENISYRKILTNAKGQFLEVFVTGNRSIHGYITSVLNDYIVFYSPVFKTLFISMQHLKWLTPYMSSLAPYKLSSSELPIVPASLALARSFEEQLKKYEGKLLVFDLGDHPDKAGLVKGINHNIVELINAEGRNIFWKMHHLKTVHIP